MYDNAPSHAAKNTSVSLTPIGYKRREAHGVAPILPWPQPYWEPLEHPQAKDLWGSEAVRIKTQLWEAILTSCTEIQAETLHKLTSSIDTIIVKVISKKWSYVNM